MSINYIFENVQRIVEIFSMSVGNVQVKWFITFFNRLDNYFKSYINLNTEWH